MQIVGALRIHAFMDNEMFSVFFRNQGVATVGATQLHRSEPAFIWWKPGIADFAHELSFGTVILVEEGFWCITTRTGAGVWDITLWTSADWADFLSVTLFVVRDQLSVGPVLTEVSDQRKFINLEFLILLGMGIIESPLFKWDISANKVNKPAVLLVKILNYRK